MLKNVLNTYQKIYKSPLISQRAKQKNIISCKNTIDHDDDTDFIINHMTPNSSFIFDSRKQNKKNNKKNKNSNISTPKEIPEKHVHIHGNCSFCAKCHPYFRMLKKERKNLVNYINKNQERNIKLIGNNRYRNATPLKYVDDNKRKISARKMGIIPLPLNKKKKNLSVLESIDYHELQRSIVMMRRIQYDRKIRKGELSNYIDDVIFIQRWWRELKNLEKIKKIQKYFRNYIKRKKLKIRNKLKRNFYQIKNILYKIMYKTPFSKINSCKHKKRPIINYKTMRKYKQARNYYYCSKTRNLISNSTLINIYTIQNFYRKHLAIHKKNILKRIKNLRPRSKKYSLITKITVNDIFYIKIKIKRKKYIELKKVKNMDYI